MARQVEQTSAVARAYEYVKTHILRTNLDGGYFLTEGQIAAELSLSRTPVREAFHRLETEGHLQIIPQKGAWVAPLGQRDIEEVMETRLMVELFCTEKVIGDGAALFDPLNVLLDEQEELIGTGTVEGFIDCDRRLHLTIVEAADNSMLSGIYESLRDRQLRMGVSAVVSTPERSRQVLDEHRLIVKTLTSGNLDAARNAVQEHLASTLSTLRRVR